MKVLFTNVSIVIIKLWERVILSNTLNVSTKQSGTTARDVTKQSDTTARDVTTSQTGRVTSSNMWMHNKRALSTNATSGTMRPIGRVTTRSMCMHNIKDSPIIVKSATIKLRADILTYRVIISGESPIYMLFPFLTSSSSAAVACEFANHRARSQLNKENNVFKDGIGV